MKKNLIIILALTALIGLPALAQPNARAARQQAQQNESQLSVRAQTRYPHSGSVPQDIVWMREVYRILEMSKTPNGALYYPVEPVGERMNLFTLIFKLLAEKKIPAYEYLLDGTERLTPEYKVEFRDILDRFQIYYEQQKAEGRRDSVLVVENSDLPSAEVLSYFIKEVWYFDQRTSTYGSRITAICPVLHRAEDFSFNDLKLPMFWVDYKDIAPYLTRMNVMTSNLNNVANSNMDDFFVSRLYNGDIYKTTNMLNQTLAQYCETDSALAKEQKRIEAELLLFESHLYGTDLVTKTDSTSVEKEKKVTTTARRRSRNEQKAPAKEVKTSRESSAPKASVRRQRR
ncbi:gliding motility protein GldN [Bacteroides sp. OttesenSCG-928-D19]|nr:gliding motility protein GldN [Bacteroides sp. OttesenSCG-928-D19]